MLRRRRPQLPVQLIGDALQCALLVGDEAEKRLFLLGEPEAFFSMPGYDGWPLVMLRLADVDLVRLTELVTDARRLRAMSLRCLVGDLRASRRPHRCRSSHARRPRGRGGRPR